MQRFIMHQLLPMLPYATKNIFHSLDIFYEETKDVGSEE